MLLSKNVVRPIKDLAQATIEFSEGTYNKRVYTESQTEIGQLYQSFNQMAERLQENDEILRRFNEQLERKVKERTNELQKANEQLRRTQTALIRTEKIAAVGQIAAGVTHEIKNPLNSLSINTQMLIRELSETAGRDSSIYESASMIRSEISRINNILEQFVKFARFPEPELVDSDVNRVVREVTALYSESAKAADIVIKETLQEDIPPIRFDERQIREVIINLLQNALRAMKNGGTVELKTLMSDGNVIIRVTDTGEGIPEKNLGKIFSPFFSTREGGMGLGLSIVQRIVESHGGKITCQSSEDTGTAFEMVLPLEKVQVQG
jgi:nitrogen fixation/metabolism regulation signal transduction histidine kinase